MAGCGGGSSPPDSAAVVSNSRSGRVQLTVSWPDRNGTKAASRYLPPYSSSLYFELYKKDTPALRFKLVVNRPDDKPSTQTVKFDQLLPAGTYTLAGVARVDKDAQGATVASAGTDVEVKPDIVTNVDLTLNSTIKSINILDQPLTVPVNGTVQLTGHALDPDGKVLFLSGGALKWSVVSGNANASISGDGVINGISVGLARVRLEEPGIKLFAEADVNVITDKKSTDVWVCDSEGKLGSYNVVTNQFTYSSTTKYNGNTEVLGDIAWEHGPNARLFAISDGRLFLVNPTTGVLTLIGSPGSEYRGISFGLNKKLYAVSSTGKFSSIDTQTAAVTVISSLLENSGYGLEFSSSDGKFYMLTEKSNIQRIEPSTGQSSIVGYTYPHSYSAYAYLDGKLFAFNFLSFAGYSLNVFTIDLTDASTVTTGYIGGSLFSVNGASSPP